MKFPTPVHAEETTDDLKESNAFRIADDRVKLKWSKVKAEQREAIRHHLIMKRGLSSTGWITLNGVYRLTHDEENGAGKEGDTIALVVQDDLFGADYSGFT